MSGTPQELLGQKVHHRISPEPAPIGDQLKEVLGAGDLFALLLERELRTRYRQTALGFSWVILQPLVPAVIFAVVLGAFARLPSADTPYLVFALSGLVLFGLFSTAVSRAGTSFIRDSQLVTKVRFPWSVLPMATGAGAVVDFVVALALLIVVMLAFGKVPGVAVLLVPVVALLTLILALAVSLAVAALNAHYRDFAIAIPFVLQIVLYGSPIVYSSELVPQSIRGLYALNPLTSLIETFRFALLGTKPPDASQILISLVTGAVIVALCVFIYTQASRDMPDVI